MWDQQPEKNASFSVKQKHGNKRERMKMKSKVLMYSLRNYNGKGTQRAESIHWKKKNLNTKEDKCHVSLLTISVLSHFWARYVNYPEIPGIGRYIQASICISPLRFSKYGCILQPPGKQRAGSEQAVGRNCVMLLSGWYFHLQISLSQLNFLCFDDAISICLA